MGRIANLLGEVAAAAEPGAEGLELTTEDWERLREDWLDEDIQDALGVVHDTLFQEELAQAADSLSARMVEVLGAFGDAEAFSRARSGGARLDLELVGHLARRVARLEEALETYREGQPPDRRGFDALRQRLADLGIESEMGRAQAPGDESEED